MTISMNSTAAEPPCIPIGVDEMPVTIVMYHYVRELARSRFRDVKGLELALFREQLAYIRRHYTIISAEELMAAVRQRSTGGRWDLPRNALVLTFDDGYIDHYRFVFPLLDEAGVQGSFFPPVRAVLDRQVLDVNKIHFILASVPDLRLAITDIYRMLDRHREEYSLPSNEELYQRLARPTRFEAGGVVFFKRLLQSALPASLRALILTRLFHKYVTADEAAFATELYAGIDELQCMARHGMYVGSHADTHPWLEELTPTQQADEIDRSLDLLRTIGTSLDGWIMCYPYGSANDSLLEVLRTRGCLVGLTTRVGISTVSEDPLLLSRLDTNDLPKYASAIPVDWTRRVQL